MGSEGRGGERRGGGGGAGGGERRGGGGGQGEGEGSGGEGRAGQGEDEGGGAGERGGPLENLDEDGQGLGARGPVGLLLAPGVGLKVKLHHGSGAL